MSGLRLLTRLQLINSFGLNEAKYCRDAKKRRRARLMVAVYVFVALMIALYTGALAFVYAENGMSGIIPAYSMVVASIVVIFMTIAKSGETLFNMRTYERLAVLPVRSADIILSRFFAMFLINFAFGLLIIAPCTAVFCAYNAVKPSFLAMMLLSAALIPLLAMTVAAILGALVVAVSSRIRHKSAVSIALMLIITLAVMFLPMLAVYGGGTEADFARLAGSLVDKLCAAYPPARLFSKAVLDADWGAMAIFAFGTMAACAAFIWVLQRGFTSICSLLSASRAGGGYEIRRLTGISPMKALYRRELKRYAASSIYVMNTAIGEILALIAGAALLIVGADTIDGALGASGLFAKLIPYAMSFMFVLSPTTTSAISIEGKQWWIIRTLPVETRDIIRVKLLVNLTIALPAWVVSTALLLIALKADLLASLAVALVPLGYILFTTALGLWMNIRMPIFDWESETAVVKQSGAVGFSMLIGMVSLIPPAACAFLAPGESAPWVSIAAFAILTAIAFGIYSKLLRARLGSIS